MSSFFGFVSTAVSFLSLSASSEEPILPVAPPAKLDKSSDLKDELFAYGFEMETVQKKTYRVVTIHHKSKLIRKIAYQGDEIVLWECYEENLLHGPCFVQGMVGHYRHGVISENPVRLNIEDGALSSLEVFKCLYRYCFIDSSFAGKVSSALSIDVTSWNIEIIKICEPTAENPSNLLVWYDVCA